MTSRLIGPFVSAVAITVLAEPAAGQALSRAADGKPDLSGIWQALNTANWNILAHGPDERLDFVRAELRAGTERQFVSPAGQLTKTVIGVGSDSATGI